VPDGAQWVDVHGDRIVVHGFCSPFRMWAGKATNYPREVAEQAIAHRLPDTVERAYQRGSQFTKRIAMMDEWSTFCDTDQMGSVVMPIRGAVG